MEVSKTLEKVLPRDQPAFPEHVQISHPDSQLLYHGSILPSDIYAMALLQGDS